MSTGKSERKTLFLSFLDGTYEEMQTLMEVLSQLGLDEEYRIIATPRPIQALGEFEMEQVISEWFGTKGMSDLNRIHNIRHSLHFIEKSIEQLKIAQKTHVSNFEQLEVFSVEINNAIQNLAQGYPAQRYEFTPLKDSTEPKLEQTLQTLKGYTPKEGAEW